MLLDKQQAVSTYLQMDAFSFEQGCVNKLH